MRILVTAIGSMSAKSVLDSLHEEGHYILACDINPGIYLPNARYANKFEQIPLATNETYCDILLKICQENKIDFLIPLTDPEVDALSIRRQFFEDINCTLCISPSTAIALSRNKMAFAKHFEKSNEIQIIPSYTWKNLIEQTEIEGVIAKPNNGRSSEGIFKTTRSEIAGRSEIAYTNYIFQPIIRGPIITVDYIRDLFGNDFCIAREELIRTSNGAGLTVKVMKDDRINKMSNIIGNDLNILGCVNFEFIYSDSNFYLMDINPRFSAGLAFSKMVGYDFCLEQLSCFNGKPIKDALVYNEMILAKEYNEIIL